MQKNTKSVPDKKVIRLEIKNQLTQSLSHLKELWGEKKFNSKVHEAVKLFTKGLHKHESSKEGDKKDKHAPVKTKAAESRKTGKKEKEEKEMEQKEMAVPEVAAPKKQSPKKSTVKRAVKSAR